MFHSRRILREWMVWNLYSLVVLVVVALEISTYLFNLVKSKFSPPPHTSLGWHSKLRMWIIPLWLKRHWWMLVFSVAFLLTPWCRVFLFIYSYLSFCVLCVHHFLCSPLLPCLFKFPFRIHFFLRYILYKFYCKYLLIIKTVWVWKYILSSYLIVLRKSNFPVDPS